MIDKYKDYYGKEAYSPSRILQQCAAKRRSLLKKLVGVRLPWGNTEDVVIDDLMEHSSPEEMRFWAQVESDEAEQKAAGSYEPRLFDDVELH